MEDKKKRDREKKERKNKERKKESQCIPNSKNVVDNNPTVPILSVPLINAAIKVQRLSEWIHKQAPSCMLSTKKPFLT